jgi:NNP family nitrate/nitrite transporter-like MFS transporter
MKHLGDLKRSGHWPSLLAAFLHFDVSFMVWIILGALGPYIAADAQIIGAHHLAGHHGSHVATLSASALGLVIAVPLLGAAFFRCLLGVLADRFGSKRVGVVSMAATLVPLLAGWLWVSSYDALICMGLFLGLAGASFAVSLPLASRWYPPHLQGLALGIAGAGNSGSVIATLCAPVLASAVGWHAVLGLLMIPVSLVLITFALMAREAPGAPRTHPLASYRCLLGRRDTYLFCLFYFITFGGFVGFSSFLNTLFVTQYHVAKAHVGVATVAFVLIGSVLRPVGGAAADRIGGARMLTLVFSLVLLSLAALGPVLSSRAAASIVLLVLMGSLGMGNGSVFQLIPQWFRGEIGTITGLVGAVGGLGGFYLNVLLGQIKDASGSYALGFGVFGLSAAIALFILRLAAGSQGWRDMPHAVPIRREAAAGRMVPVGVPGQSG